LKPHSCSPSDRAAVLIEALPYIREFYGTTVVIKYGGNAMLDEDLKESVMADLCLLQLVGIQVVLVHGGGPDINALMAKTNLEPKFVNGLRVTDEETMEIVEMALTRTNKGLVGILSRHGAKAIGLSGKDANLLVARKVKPEGEDLGFVGEVVQINDELLKMLAGQGYIPVICSVAHGQDGHAYNVNADTAAGAVAAAIKAHKLIVLTDVEGLYDDFSDKSSLLSRLTVDEARAMVASGKAGKGMIPKLEACIEAVQSGVERAHLIDGRLKHSMLIEMFTDQGIGTMVVPNPAKRPGLSDALLGGYSK
jgi:acetylglutamate kinase